MTNPDKNALPQVRPLGPPESVLVYNCVLFVRAGDGSATARVANAADIVITAASEREAIMKAVERFKARLTAAAAAGETPQLDDGPYKAQPGEQQRLIAIHL